MKQIQKGNRNMKTYQQWKISEMRRLRAILGGNLQAGDLDGVTPEMWHKLEIIPSVEKGESLSLNVCRSIVKHGGGYSLEQISRFWPSSVPANVIRTTGRIAR